MLYPQLANEDLAYPLRVNFIAPFRGAALMAQMEVFDDFVKCASTVEWLFGDIGVFQVYGLSKNLK